MNRWGPALVFGLLLTACAPETSITLEGQLRDRLKVKYGADFELVALEESTDAGSRALCAVVRQPSKVGNTPAWPREQVVLTADGQFLAGYVTDSAFLQEWTKYCGSRFFNLVTPVP